MAIFPALQKLTHICINRIKTPFLSQKRAIMTFLSRKFMIKRSSIAFEDFLGSSIVPQVMPPWLAMPYALYRAVLYVGINYLGKGLVGRGAWTREPGKYPWERKRLFWLRFSVRQNTLAKYCLILLLAGSLWFFFTCVTMGLRGGDDDG